MKQKMGLFNYFHNLSLGVRLNIVVVLVLSLLLLTIVSVADRGVNTLANKSGRQRVAQEVETIRNRFAEAEQEILASAKLVAATPGLNEAIKERDAAKVRTITLVGAAPFGFDDVDVVDLDGIRLATVVNQDEESYDGIQEDSLLSLPLLGIEATGVIAEKSQDTDFRLAAVVPVYDAAGTVIGGLLGSRKVNDEFLARMNFSRNDVTLLLIHEGQILSQNSAVADYFQPPQVEKLAFLDQAAIARAWSGQYVIADDLIKLGEASHAIAYVPLTVLGETKGVLAILVNLSKLTAFKDELIRNLTATILFLTSVAVSVMLLFSWKSIVIPIGALKATTEQMTQGDYSKRAMIATADEVGQLAQAFNEMASAVQKRESELQHLTTSLEEQVEERTATLQATNESLQREIADRERAEAALRVYAAKLEQSNRELESFAYVASHDLQEPLRKVQAFGERLQAKYSDSLGEQGRDYLQRMQGAATRMQNLIHGLLTYSRITTKAQPFVPVDLTQIAHEVISDLETRIEQASGRVEVGKLPVIEADPTQMRQLLQNLIGNALKFHRKDEAPVVNISAEVLNGGGGYSSVEGPPHIESYQISVADNGIGFDEKYLDRIFQVFQRLHGRSEFEGTGIGLATCRKIVERHAGTITATSAPEQGAIFVITLPYKQSDGVN